MKKVLLSFSLLLLLGLGVKAQYPVVSIDSVQQPINLSACNDTSVLFGDTVTVRGIVITDGGLAQSAGGRNVWIRDGVGPYSGIDIYGFSGTATTPDDITNLVMGDSVEITGYVDEYNGESEIRPLNATVLGTGNVVNPVVISNVCDLNDASQNNNLTNGEQWEGQFVELNNVTVTSVDYFSGGSRVSFIVQDGNGCKVNISDRFIVQRLPANGGTFVPPTVGDQYCHIRGVLSHSRNNCPGSNGRGYEIYPFDTSHYGICSAAPSIFNESRSVVCPSSSNMVNVSAEITDSDGITGANLLYRVGTNCSGAWTSVAMTNTSGNVWAGNIPAQSDQSFVEYYIEATDGQSNTAELPGVSNGSDPFFYRVNDDGCTVYDVQYVPQCYSSDQSGYRDMTVTVTGVVTASAEPTDLGTVFIQQENKLDWAGILLTGNPSLASLKVGDKIDVTGDVEESFGFTQIGSVSNITTAGTGTIAPSLVDPDDFTTYDFATNERWEGMLISLDPGTGGSLYVVEQSADGASNFAEYRVGTDQFNPSSGSRVQAGRQTGSSISSLNVSYVNDSSWATQDGLMNVPVCVVSEGTAFDTITGVMYYSFGAFKLLPRNNSDYVGGYANTCPSVSVDPGYSTSAFVAYPNPAAAEVNVDFDFGKNFNGTARIIDMMGRVMMETPVSGSNGTINMNASNLANGQYILSINGTDGGMVWHTKINVIH